MVERVQKRSILAYQSNFRCGRTGVDTEEAVALVGGQIFFHYFCLRMTFTELIKFLLIVEQRIQTLYLKCNLNFGVQTLDHVLCGDCLFLLGEKGRSGSCKQVGELRDNRVLLIQFQGTDKAFAKFGEEVKRSSQECYMAADRFTTGQAADGLVDHCLENGGRQVFLGSTLVDERLNIRLCKYTAAGCNGVQRPVMLCVFV